MFSAGRKERKRKKLPGPAPPEEAKDGGNGFSGTGHVKEDAS